jgi:hypothetical protein
MHVRSRNHDRVEVDAREKLVCAREDLGDAESLRGAGESNRIGIG